MSNGSANQSQLAPAAVMGNVGAIAAETAQVLVGRIAGTVSADEAKKAPPPTPKTTDNAKQTGAGDKANKEAANPSKDSAKAKPAAKAKTPATKKAEKAPAKPKAAAKAPAKPRKPKAGGDA